MKQRVRANRRKPKGRQTHASYKGAADKIETLAEYDLNSGCWLWPYFRPRPTAKGNLSYGEFVLNGRRSAAHRAAYEAFIGPIPAGLNVLHKCDVPQCCNPAHLFVGTATDNMRDMQRKGRGIRPGGGRRATPPEVVTEVRRYSKLGMSTREIGRAVGVNHVTAWKIIQNA